jgi:hypothetical protein
MGRAGRDGRAAARDRRARQRAPRLDRGGRRGKRKGKLRTPLVVSPPLSENRRGAGLRPLQRERLNLSRRRVVTVAKDDWGESFLTTLHARPKSLKGLNAGEVAPRLTTDAFTNVSIRE